MTFLPANLRYLRKQHLCTQQVVAAQLCIKQRTYAAYEEGRAEPNNSILIAMSELFAVSIHSLVLVDMTDNASHGGSENIVQTRYALSNENVKGINKFIIEYMEISELIPDDKNFINGTDAGGTVIQKKTFCI